MNSFSPLSSRGGIHFNDCFVADPEDRSAKRIHRPLPVFVSHIERLFDWTALLDTVSGCFSLCVIHNALNTITVPKQKRAKDRGCIEILEGKKQVKQLRRRYKMTFQDKTGDILIFLYC